MTSAAARADALGLAIARHERPRTAEEAAAALADCASLGQAVVPVGAGTALTGGGAPSRCDVALHLEELSGIVDYVPEDLTLTARAGTPVDLVRRTLAERGQTLPGIAAGPGTLGGLVASGWTASSSREAHGALHHRLLGAQVASPGGKLTRSGGRVVKNVTGYDLHRMQVVGGSLGVLTEVSFRLEPIPEKRKEVAVEVTTWEKAQEAWLWQRREGFEPSFLEGALAEAGSPRLIAWFEGDAEPVESAATALAAGWSRMGTVFQRDLDPAGVQQGALPEILERGRGRLRVSFFARPTRVIPEFARVCDEARALGLDTAAACFPHSGDFHLLLGGSADTLAGWAWDVARAFRGGWLAYVMAEESPALPLDLPRWSGEPGALRLLARVKRAVDPKGVLRPGSHSADALERSAGYFEETRA